MKNLLSTLIFSSALFSASFVSGQTVHLVDSNGGGDFTTINAAITAASNGDTLKILSGGTYVEQVTLSKSLQILSEDTTSTLTYTSNAFTFASGSDGSRLQGLKIINSRVYQNANIGSITLSGNVFEHSDFYTAVGNSSSSLLTVDNNVFQGTPAGTFIRVEDSSGQVVISNNTINNNSTSSYGIDVDPISDRCVIYNNTINQNNSSGRGIVIDGNNGIVSNNTVTGGVNGIFGSSSNFSIIGNIVSQTSGTGIECYHSSNVKIAGNKVSGCGNIGIYLNYSLNTSTYSNVLVTNNLVINSGGQGINTHRGSGTLLDFSIKNNVVYGGSSHGISLSGTLSSSSFVAIENNILMSNSSNGISFSSSVSLQNYNCLFNNGSNSASGVGNIEVNPNFADPQNEVFTLQSGSPCIDAGNPALLDYDLDLTQNDMGIFGGSNTWNNYNGNSSSSQVVSLGIQPNNVNPNTTITINAVGFAK